MVRSAALCLLLVTNAGLASKAEQKSGVDSLGWISGCWMSGDEKRRTEEQWMKPSGQSMLGIGRTVAGGKTVMTEFIQIHENTGETLYTVLLGIKGRPVSFKLIRSSDQEAVFENPEHDFPQRIIYRRESSDSLFARIEGQEKGVNKGLDFRYKRTPCE